MRSLISKIRFPEEEALLSFMQAAFNATIINQLISMREKHSSQDQLSAYMKGYLFPLTKKLGSRLYGMCWDVLEEFGYEQRGIEFYISNNPEPNALSFYQKEGPHLIVFNAGLLDLLDDKALKFVIGHELGHLIFEHSLFNKVIRFIYPEYNDLPPLLTGLFDLWNKLSEISADRIGLLASKDIEASISAMFQLSSGLSEKILNFNTVDFMDMVNKILTEMSEIPSHIYHSHPANPVRIKALWLFHQSETWKALIEKKEYKEDTRIDKKLFEVIDLLRKKPETEREKSELDFLASAGFILMTIDEEVAESEYDYLVNLLSGYYYWPKEHLDTVVKSGDIRKILDGSASFITSNFPERTRALYKALVTLLTRDRKLKEKEVLFILGVADKNLKIPRLEAIEILLEGLKRFYAPLS